MTPHTSQQRVNQSGMVSILVTLIMMLVISLIVIGFAQVSRREQSQAVDRQLSAQAFFAAESGVNDVRSTVAQLPIGSDIQDKTTCAPDSNYTASSTIDAANNVSYPCLLVSTKLDNLNISSLPAGGASTNLPLEPDSGTISTMHIAWSLPTAPTAAQVASCKGTVPANANFTASSSWTCPYGVLRLDIVPTGSLSRAAMAAGQKTMFLYPTTGGGSASYGAATGSTPAMKCTTTNCGITISGMGGSTNYALRLSAIYVTGAVNITAQGPGGTNLLLKNAQILVDATGKAQDVLRRIQVRLPISPSAATPDYAIESGSSICKRFGVSATSFTINGIVNGQDPSNPLCNTTSVGPPAPPPAPGDAQIDAYCDIHPAACDPATKNPAEKPIWQLTFRNKSVNDPANVEGCEWSMGDGKTPAQNGLNNKSCQTGNTITYVYPSNPAYKTCQDVLDGAGKTPYTVFVTIFLAGNQQAQSVPQKVYVPANC